MALEPDSVIHSSEWLPCAGPLPGGEGSAVNQTGTGSPSWGQCVWVGGGHKLTGFSEALGKCVATKMRRGGHLAGKGVDVCEGSELKAGGHHGRHGCRGTWPHTD